MQLVSLLFVFNLNDLPYANLITFVLLILKLIKE